MHFSSTRLKFIEHSATVIFDSFRRENHIKFLSSTVKRDSFWSLHTEVAVWKVYRLSYQIRRQVKRGFSTICHFFGNQWISFIILHWSLTIFHNLLKTCSQISAHKLKNFQSCLGCSFYDLFLKLVISHLSTSAAFYCEIFSQILN